MALLREENRGNGSDNLVGILLSVDAYVPEDAEGGVDVSTMDILRTEFASRPKMSQPEIKEEERKRV